MPSAIQGRKFNWKLPEPVPETQVQELSAHIGLSFPVLELLIRRGYATQSLFEQFLLTPRDQVVTHPSKLKDAEKTAERIKRAIAAEEKILIVGDYDVDGMTGTALFMTTLLPLGARANFFLPHRVKDGYGLSPKIVERAVASGYKLLITVDNGTAAYDAALCAQAHKIDLIITDHHQPQHELPPAYAFVNPWQSDCNYPFKHLAGVGVAFKVMSLVYEQMGVELPEGVYELLTMGTIADVMPLIGENRYWIRHGLHCIQEKPSVAMNVLSANAKLSRRITALDIGFFLAPQLNALGRLDDPRAAISFLIGGDQAETERIGKTLYELNQQRKTIESNVVNDVVDNIKGGRLDPYKNNIIVAASQTWPPGVVGLAASRLVAAYGRPALLLHDIGDGILKGSGRSIAAFNLFDGLTEARDLLLHFGGHASAVGLALKAENLSLLIERLSARIARDLTADDFIQQLACDATLTLQEANHRLCADLAYLEPFGTGNEKPVFYLPRVSVLGKPALYKGAHVRCSVFADGIIKPIIFFNRPELYPLLLAAENKTIDCAVQILENEWEGRRRIELQGIDVSL